MTRAFSLLTILLSVLLTGSLFFTFVSAQENEITEETVEVPAASVDTPNETATSARQPAVNAQERLQQLQELRSERQAATAERRAALQERAQTRILNLAANLSNRMDAAIRRFESISSRLASRIDTMEAAGSDVSAARTQLTQAEQELERARTILSTIDNDVIQFVSSENPQANWLRVRNVYTDARDTLKATHSALLSTLRLLADTDEQTPATEVLAE